MTYRKQSAKRTTKRKGSVKRKSQKKEVKQTDSVLGYCLRCKKKKEMFKVQNPKILPNGAVMLKGECGLCQTKMSAFQKRQ